MNTKTLIATLLVAAALDASAQLKSPSGKLQCDYGVDNGQPYYTLSFNGKTVIDKSHLGFVLTPNTHREFTNNEDVKDQNVDLTTGLKITA